LAKKNNNHTLANGYDPMSVEKEVGIVGGEHRVSNLRRIKFEICYFHSTHLNVTGSLHLDTRFD
jgi:hypothetical protein